MDEKIIFTNGAFDITHSGHYNLLCYCRMLAGPYGKVVVGLDSDEKVQNDKGATRPYFNFQEREKNLLFLNNGFAKLVDIIIKFNSHEELYDLIEGLKPSCLVKGSDWEGRVVGSDLVEVKFFKRDNSFSTTNIVERVLQKHNIVDSKIDPFNLI